MRSICVFCGASPGKREEYAEAARELAVLLVKKDIRIVYGAGSVGLMGILADAALAEGGQVVGVIPEHLCSKEVLHDNLSELHVTESLLERKWLMMELADGFIALPGGLGTLDELLEVYTWAQLGRHTKPVGLVDTCSYFNPFLRAFEQAIEEGFLTREFRSMLTIAADPAALFDKMLASAAVHS
jgi:uncharacterized protein (TIGR00730 family)